MRTLLLGGLLAAAASNAPLQAQQRDIVDTAVAAGSFETLAAALNAAGLVDALKGEGPFTVFAPTDEAFAALPHGALEGLLAAPAQLTRVLTYHVVPGRLAAPDVAARRSLLTLNGQRAALSATDDGLRIAGARIVKTDIACTNGVIHVIDAVLMPATKNLVETAAAAGSFQTLLAAAEAAGLAATLSGEGPFTVFAPTDEAFSRLPKGALESLLTPQGKARLVEILKLHVVSGRVYADEALAAGSAASLQGSALSLRLEEGRFEVGSAGVVANDIDASNGVIHVIDSVLLPPAPRPTGPLIVGIFTGTPGAALASQLGIEKRSEALLVTRVSRQESGLQVHDVIVTAAHRPCTKANFARAKEEAGAGGKIELVVLRGGREQTLRVPVVIDGH